MSALPASSRLNVYELVGCAGFLRYRDAHSAFAGCDRETALWVVTKVVPRIQAPSFLGKMELFFSRLE